MPKTSLRKIILALNLASLGCYALTALALQFPLKLKNAGFFAGYEALGVLFVGLGSGSLLGQTAGVLTIAHLLRERRWSHDLALTVVTALGVPLLVVFWSVHSS